MSGTTVVAGSSPSGLAQNLARTLEANFIAADVRVFPDGESKVTLSEEPAGRCIVVQSTHPPVDTNILRALSLVSEADDHADEVVAVVPYLGYARQDREFLAGEMITAKHIAKLFAGAGADLLVTVDVHSTEGLEYFGMGRNVSAVPDLAAYLAGMKLTDPLAVSPDMGGGERTRSFAKSMGIDWLVLEKERDRSTGEVAIRSSEADAAGRDVILVDDMISTGGSMVKACEFMKEQGCGRVFAACTHALMVKDADLHMRRAGVEKIVGSNTIPGPIGVVDVSGAIAKALYQ